MVYQAQIDTKLTFTKVFLLLVFFAFGTIALNAQDETTAEEATGPSLYNDGLALLKERKYVEGYDMMMKALEKGMEEENEQVIKLSKKNGAVAAYSAGNLSLKDEDYDKAMEYYESGKELNPEYSSNVIGIGKVLDAKGEKVKAVASYMEAAKIAEGNEKGKKEDEAYTRAKLIIGKLFAAKEYDTAVEAGNIFIAQHDEAEVHYYVSRCQTELGDHEGALASAEKAIEVGKANETIEDKFYVAKGLALEGLGRTSDAIEAYKLVDEGDYKEQAEYKIQQLSGK